MLWQYFRPLHIFFFQSHHAREWIPCSPVLIFILNIQGLMTLSSQDSEQLVLALLHPQCCFFYGNPSGHVPCQEPRSISLLTPPPRHSGHMEDSKQTGLVIKPRVDDTISANPWLAPCKEGVGGKQTTDIVVRNIMIKSITFNFLKSQAKKQKWITSIVHEDFMM